MVLAQHLMLKAFECVWQKTLHSEVVLGLAKGFVSEGGRAVWLVSIEAMILGPFDKGLPLEMGVPGSPKVEVKWDYGSIRITKGRTV
jgi:hypothetical protein